MRKTKPKSLSDALDSAPTLGNSRHDEALRFLSGCPRWGSDKALIDAVATYAQAAAEYDDTRRTLILAAESAGIGVQWLDHEPSRARVASDDLARLHDLRRENDSAHSAKRSALAALTNQITPALASPEAIEHARALVSAAEAATAEAADRASEAEALLRLAAVPLTGAQPYISQAATHLNNDRQADESTDARLHRLAAATSAALADAAPENAAVAS